MSIARIFPRKISMTPVDPLVFFGDPPLFGTEGITEAHVSCLFTWDIPKAEYLKKSWERLGIPVKLGGVAFNTPAEEFTPGLYVKDGCTITSRGCNNNCWFCSVPAREGKIRELEVKPGTRILDNNLLQTSDVHFLKVCDMLKKQPGRIYFDGGFEAKVLREFHVQELSLFSAKIKMMYFAYDTPDDYEPLIVASKLLAEAGLLNAWKTYCYILCGYRGDTIDKTLERITQVGKLGFFPYVMYYQSDVFKPKPGDWHKFVRRWSRPALCRTELKRMCEVG